MAKAPKSSALWEQYWDKPGDLQLLRVYADALEQEGNARGTFIQLCLTDSPTEAQQTQKRTLLSKTKKLLAGPGGEYLREFDFAANGLVGKARAEADKVIAGIEAIGQISPRLILTITSVKTLKLAQQFAKTSLERIYFVDFGWITGTHGGMQMTDKILEAIAPALANVRHLQLSCRGAPATCFSPDGLRVLGRHATRLRYLSVDYDPAGLAPPADYARAIAETPGFASLRALDFEGVTAQDLGTLELKLNAMPLRLDATEARADLADRLEAVLA
jgi:hypothetical protein